MSKIDIGSEVFSWGVSGKESRYSGLKLVNGILADIPENKFKIIHKDGEIYHSYGMVFDYDNLLYSPQENKLFKIKEYRKESLIIEDINSKPSPYNKKRMIRAERDLVVIPKKGDLYFHGTDTLTIENVSLYSYGMVFSMASGEQIPQAATNRFYSWVPEALKNFPDLSKRTKVESIVAGHITLGY